MARELTIGKVAKQAGVNIQTIHYYERRGILKPSDRKESGYRLYTPDAIQKIRFIKIAQELGFTLREISELLRLRVSATGQCGQIKRKAEAKLKDVQSRIIKMKALKRTLGGLVKICQNQDTTDDCPILKSLNIKDTQDRILRSKKVAN